MASLSRFDQTVISCLGRANLTQVLSVGHFGPLPSFDQCGQICLEYYPVASLNIQQFSPTVHLPSCLSIFQIEFRALRCSLCSQVVKRSSLISLRDSDTLTNTTMCEVIYKSWVHRMCKLTLRDFLETSCSWRCWVDLNDNQRRSLHLDYAIFQL